MAAKRRVVQAPKPRPRARTKPPGLLWAALGAGALATALIAVSVLGGRGPETPAGPVDGTETAALLEGIPQQGTALGMPDAPVTIVEYADVQCPFCAEFSRAGYRELVERYVRDGRVRIEYRGLAFLGEDSEEGLRAALAAGRQGKLHHVLHLLYEHQGREGSGWLTDDLLRRVGEAVPGLDVDRMLADMSSARVDEAIDEASTQARRDAVEGTPTFTIARTGEAATKLGVGALGLDSFEPAVDAILGAG